VRALLGAYSGNLYKVKRASDGMMNDIGVLSPGGLADSAAQDASVPERRARSRSFTISRGPPIVLGSGGDCCYSNNSVSQGTYEGAIVSGYPSDATDDAIQANIVNAGYGK